MADEHHPGAALAEDFRALGDRLYESSDVGAALHGLVMLARDTIEFCDWAGITQAAGRLGDRFTTIAATDPIARTADDLQYEFVEGPCVDAAATEGLFAAGDLRSTPDWPRFGAKVTAQTPIRSLLSLSISPAPTGAALNLYSGSVGAFTAASVDDAAMFGTHAHVLLILTRQTTKIMNLNRALTTSRLVGNAVGILMYAHRITAEQAFDRLTRASQRLNRTTVDLSAEITRTGALPPGPSRPTPRR